jgi:hypothetical protein
MDPVMDSVLRIRVTCADRGTNEFHLQVMDPVTWQQCGPYAMRFRSTEEAIGWLQAHASLHDDDVGVEEVEVGTVLLGSAPAALMRAIVSALQAGGALVLPGSPPWWSYEVDESAPTAVAQEIEEERLGFTFGGRPSYGPGVLDFRYGVREPVLVQDVRIEQWAQTGREPAVVVYMDALTREPLFATLKKEPSPESGGFIFSTEELGDVKIRPFDESDVIWLSRFPIGHDARSADLLVRAYRRFTERNQRPFNDESDTPLEFIHAVAEPGGDVISRVTYGFVSSDEDIPDAYFHPALERRGERWVACDRPVTLDHEICILEPYAAQALVDCFDAGIAIPVAFARLGVVDAGVEYLFESLPRDAQVFVREMHESARQLPGTPLVAADRLNQFVNHAVAASARALVAYLADILQARGSSGPPIVEPSVPTGHDDGPIAVTFPGDDSEARERFIEFTAALLALSNEGIELRVTPMKGDGTEVEIALSRDSEEPEFRLRIYVAWIYSAIPSDLSDLLESIGWDPPEAGKIEEFHRFYDSDDADPGTIAASLAVTLREVFGAHPTDSFRFEPVALVKELLAGNFGPRFMLDTESMGGAS